MKYVKRIASILVVGVIFYFLLQNLIKNWQQIPFHDLHFNIIYVLVSFAFLVINFLIFVQGWRQIMQALGNTISFNKAFWIMSSSQLAKYVPGGIWFALGRVYLGKGENLREELVAVSVVVETGLTFLVGILLFVISFMLSGQHGIKNFIFLIPVFVLFVIVLYPSLLNRLLATALKLFKRPSMRIAIPYSQLLFLSVFFIGLWVSQIIGFYFLINAVYTVPFSQIVTLAAAYTLSWMTGFIIIFAPGGLGVREGMMTLLLSSLLPVALAIGISFIARVWMTVFEILIFFVGLLIRRWSGHQKTRDNLD